MRFNNVLKDVSSIEHVVYVNVRLDPSILPEDDAAISLIAPRESEIDKTPV
jgi:hypothetical protein